MESPVSSNNSRSLWPVCILGALVLILLSSVFFVVFCSLQSNDLVANDYYEQELKYQGQMQRMANASQLTGTAGIGYDARQKTLTVTVPCPDPSSRLTGRIELYRPSAARLDQAHELKVDATGSQRLDLRGLLPGLWKVRVSWRAGEKEYFLDKAIVVDSTLPG
jgi:hypothetical protein